MELGLKDRDLIEAPFSPEDPAPNQFNHSLWAKAAAIPIDRYWSGIAAPKGRHAEARIIWSAMALSVRFVCQQTEPLVVSSTPQLHKKALGLWDRDVCEIFIAPEPEEPNRYFEFEAAPNGEWIDLALHVGPARRETDWDFHSGMRVAAVVSKYHVTIGMQIPWDDWMHMPQRGEEWRVNLFRCVGSDPQRGYLAWQPTLTPTPNFHVPNVFGRLKFV